ncbi:hypothetical protein PAXRUDRAFT_823867 [Paxillus rubicundulus Ve08.2h10]|uniref:Uncharacterized protein n=1 Tax=Paxillus rubicundulus Ve08.2h10 TaxID=930991 RepID=A0A0D0DV40_9AGAM|nr:hypothetical protein PAXRUDRAFT_823867 [Paxillus rubicundulus Ve08.2h10]
MSRALARGQAHQPRSTTAVLATCVLLGNDPGRLRSQLTASDAEILWFLGTNWKPRIPGYTSDLQLAQAIYSKANLTCSCSHNDVES